MHPSGDLELPPLPLATLKRLGQIDKPLILKERIVRKNQNHHPDLTPTDDLQILNAALYHPTILIQDKPGNKPGYWVMVQEAGRNRMAVVELSDSKVAHEIVGWHYVDDASLQRKQKRAIREGGQVLITKGIEPHGAAALSALPNRTPELSIASPAAESNRPSSLEPIKQAEVSRGCTPSVDVNDKLP